MEPCKLMGVWAIQEFSKEIRSLTIFNQLTKIVVEIAVLHFTDVSDCPVFIYFY